MDIDDLRLRKDTSQELVASVEAVIWTRWPHLNTKDRLHDKWYCFEELTIVIPFTKGNQTARSFERHGRSDGGAVRGPEFLKCIDSIKRLGSCLFKSMLPMPKLSPQPHRVGQKVCVMAVSRVRLGMFDVSVRVVKPPSIEKQRRQREMNSKQQSEPVEKRRSSEGYLEMVNGLFCTTL